ncbi:MAG: GbsR/MarR family transcriptional regulator [Candidatus Helarchaeota archaeon]
MNKKNSDLETQLIEIIENLIWSLGFEQLQARLIGVLWVSNEPLSLEYLRDSCGYGASALSIVLRDMGRYGVIKIIKKKNDRKTYFQIEKNWLRNLISRVMEFNINKALREIEDVQNSFLKDIDEETKREKAQLIHKINTFRTQITKFVNIIGKFLDSIPRLE